MGESRGAVEGGPAVADDDHVTQVAAEASHLARHRAQHPALDAETDEGERREDHEEDRVHVLEPEKQAQWDQGSGGDRHRGAEILELTRGRRQAIRVVEAAHTHHEVPEDQVGADEQHVEDGHPHLEHADPRLDSRLSGGERDGTDEAGDHDGEIGELDEGGEGFPAWGHDWF